MVSWRKKILSIFRGEEEGELLVQLLVAERVLLVFVALLSTTFATFFGKPDNARNIQELYSSLALIFGCSALSAIYLIYKRSGIIFNLIQILIDIAIVTGVVKITGGYESPFTFLYILLVLSAGVFFPRNIAIISAVGSVAAFQIFVEKLTNNNSLLFMIGFGSCLLLVAVLTSGLTKKLQVKILETEEVQRSLNKIRAEQKVLIDEIPEGVITTTPEYEILSVNRAAEKLFNLTEDSVKNLKLTNILSRVSKDFERQSSLSYPSITTPQEAEIINLNGMPAKRLSYYAKKLFGFENEHIGYLYLFQDITKIHAIQEQLALQEKMARLISENSVVRRRITEKDMLIGESEIFRKMIDLIDRVSPSDATVLISGESGTGKELVAREIHRKSDRSKMSFVPVNCGAIPADLLESELFGHKRGSFTGAVADSLGLVRRAEHGTLFLDEIGELPLAMQAKLLRMLQERTVRPVGGENDISVNVRIIAATNRNLKDEVANGRFREDLYYRLNVVNIVVPPLRDRKDDIPLLVTEFLNHFKTNGEMPTVSPAAMHSIMQHDYPGNVRELENVIERALVLGSDVILPEHLPEQIKRSDFVSNPQFGGKVTEIIVDNNLQLPVQLDDLLNDVEKKYLLCALEQTQGVRTKAADLLGINFRSFRYRLQKLGMKDE